MVKIAIFYHLYQKGKWVDVFNNQIEMIHSSGLYDAIDFMHIGINGQTKISDNNKIISKINSDQNREESPTLIDLKNFCIENKDYKILYIHSKGVTKDFPEIDDWRSLMEYFVIEKWQLAIEKLNTYDAYGCNYSEDTWLGRYPHFSGNFWWANAEYINKLNHLFLYSEQRLDREFWIGTGNGKLFSVHNSQVNHYQERYDRSKYVGR